MRMETMRQGPSQHVVVLLRPISTFNLNNARLELAPEKNEKSRKTNKKSRKTNEKKTKENQ